MNENALRLQAPWEEVKERLKEINTQLTDADLIYEPGNEDQMLKSLSGKLKKNETDVKALIESISSNKGKAS